MVIRKLPVGAEILSDLVSFRVWAPERKSVCAVIGKSGLTPDMVCELKSEGNGYFSAEVRNAAAGDLYGFRLDDDDKIYPDPASRFQPLDRMDIRKSLIRLNFVWSDQRLARHSERWTSNL